jgi:hypothetical protein
MALTEADIAKLKEAVARVPDTGLVNGANAILDEQLKLLKEKDARSKAIKTETTTKAKKSKK